MSFFRDDVCSAWRDDELNAIRSFAVAPSLARLAPVPGPSAKPPSRPTPKGPARAVVRLERKQRRGKEVTVVEKLDLAPAELETWCRELKQAMGCGGSVEDDAIVLQGDLRSACRRC